MENLNKEAKHLSQGNPTFEDIDINQVKKILLDPRYISKSFDPEGRKDAAKHILEQREKLHQIKRDIEEKTKLLNDFWDRFEKLHQSLTESANGLKSILIKVREFFLGESQKLETLQELEAIRQKIEEVQREIDNLRYQQQRLSNAPQELLDYYYEKVSCLPLSQEEKRNFLKPEILSQLSLEEYIALWRRLNPYFLSHVTRQGFRDHYSMFAHSGGIGNFHNGFKEILRDSKMLRPPSAMRWESGFLTGNREVIRKFLEEKIFPISKSAEEARRNLGQELNFTIAYAPLYPDKIALHFACQDVLDNYYGGERGNEIFFVFPVDFIASQYHYAFNSYFIKDFTRPEKDGSFNDVFVWTGDLADSGISIDAGIVFIPADTLVDPETGSKYASRIENGNRVLVEDDSLIEKFINWLVGIDNESYLAKLYNAILHGKDEYSTLSNYLFQQMNELGFDNEMASRLKDEIIYNQIRLILNPTKLTDSYPRYKEDLLTLDEENKRKKEIQIIADIILTKTMAKFKKAENPITSKEYWTRYFDLHPELKPKHLVFYRGNPASAVLEFLLENNIGQANTSEVEGALLGFDDHHIVNLEDRTSLAWQGYDDLIRIAEELIDKHYAVNDNKS